MKTKKNIQAVKFIFLLLICLTSGGVYAQAKGVESANRLFHIERSKNRNLVCYDIKLIDGALDTKQPLDVYWVNQEENPGEVKGLSAIEKKFAYGYKIVSRGEECCNVILSAYPGRELTIYKEGDKYICTVTIDKEISLLQKLYVKAKPGNSLSVEYVELTGVNLKTGKEVSERVSK